MHQTTVQQMQQLAGSGASKSELRTTPPAGFLLCWRWYQSLAAGHEWDPVGIGIGGKMPILLRQKKL